MTVIAGSIAIIVKDSGSNCRIDRIFLIQLPYFVTYRPNKKITPLYRVNPV